ncbi:glycosyltransferase [Acinetobacter sp. ANC 3791]|uniref:glycosyltransferase n=1 Tax=Acinetobacter sp. ANC 3791 TaxID=2529836 RepID=UPI00103C1107|nr:glycosyltransferase [Acinetobacter sp. ANC 3791]TCB84419.1 glycosyltransferase [Acinetobacter sp. ANC 3791]
MKKILLIADELSGRGGTEKVLKTFYHHFNNYKEYQVNLLLLNSCKHTTWLDNINYETYDVSDFLKGKRKRNILLRCFLQGKIKKNYKYKIMEGVLREVIKNKNPDIVISIGHCYLSQLDNIRNINMLDYKIVFWDHMSHSYYLSGNKEFVKNINVVDHFFSISTGIKKSLLQLGISDNKISLIYNPIKKQEVNKFNIEKIKFIYIGRLFSYDQKRCMDIVHAIKKIENLDFIFEFYGDGQDKDQLILECKKLGIDHKIIFKGWFDQPWDYIEDASCLILASQYEGFGLVLAEAISYGIPCISSNCKFGPEDIIISHVNGNLFEVGNVDQLARMMEEFILDPFTFKIKGDIRGSISELYEDNCFKKLENVVESL